MARPAAPRTRPAAGAEKPAAKKAPAKKAPARKAPARKAPARTSASKPPAYRLPALAEATLAPAQRALLDAMRSGPRGGGIGLGGPFGVFLHAPAYGVHAQALGAHCRYGTVVPARLSEFAILVTARLWRAQYEWHVHAPIAEKAGVKPSTLAALRAGRVPARAPADERAVHAFVTELYTRRRVSDRTYARLHSLLGDAGMVEFVGILGYYALVAMTLDVFRVPLPAGVAPFFPEPKA
ncbi:carboxymuconolactone decarboxylase family protein [Rhodoplanes serenus]|nr:carboxymuconolactone decarboxylase family protein [Rhodoplanes serenus]